MSRLWVTPEEMGTAGTSVYAYEACRSASFILWALSGRKYAGTSTITETYECPTRRPLIERGIVDPVLFEIDASWIASNMECGCPGAAGQRHSRIRLRGRPVRRVMQVTKDGEVVDPSQYQLADASVLQSAPGASLDLCGITITYTYGTEPPTAGRRAARYLATELVKSYSGEECELPERVTSVARQGVTITVLDEQTFLDDQRTGVYAVDLFLKTVNPDKARKPAKVFSPDMPKGRRVSTNVKQPVLGPFDLGVVPGEEFVWRLPLAGVNGELLTDEDWEPQGLISTWSGAVVIDAAADHFEVVGNELVLTMSATETGRMNLGGSGSWDLYAVNKNDSSTVIHIMSSNVYLVAQSSLVPIV